MVDDVFNLHGAQLLNDGVTSALKIGTIEKLSSINVNVNMEVFAAETVMCRN